jgi:hypothetical protein
VVHVERGYAVAEDAEHVPQARRVGAGGDEDGDVAAGRDQVVLADEPLDSFDQCLVGHVGPVYTGVHLCQ